MYVAPLQIYVFQVVIWDVCLAVPQWDTMFFLEDYRVRRRHTSHAKPTRKGCSNLPVVGGIARTGHEEKDGNQGMFILYNWHLDKCISCSPKFASKSLLIIRRHLILIWTILLQCLAVLACTTAALYYMKRFKFSVLKSRKVLYAPKNYSDSQKYRIEN